MAMFNVTVDASHALQSRLSVKRHALCSSPFQVDGFGLAKITTSRVGLSHGSIYYFYQRAVSRMAFAHFKQLRIHNQ